MRLQTAVRVLTNYPWRIPALMADDRVFLKTVSMCADAPLPEGAVLRTRLAGPLRLGHGADVSEAREILISNMYCQRGFLPRPGWCVLDVGANLGLFGAWAIPLLRRGTLVAVEPVVEVAELGERNLRYVQSRNPGVRVHWVRSAVAERWGDLELLLPRGPQGLACATGWTCARDTPCAALVQAAGGGLPRWVRCEPLDALVERVLGPDVPRVDLLKVDIEGMEAECFAGASRTLGRTRRVVFEYHGHELLERCARLLRAAGLREVLRRAPYGDEFALSFWAR